MMPKTIYIACIPLLPLAEFIFLGLFGKRHFSKSAGIFGVILLFVSAALAVYVAYAYFFQFGNPGDVYQTFIPFKYEWLRFSPTLSINMGILLDPISVMMLVVVSFISLMVHVYSLAYMKSENRFSTYYAFLGLFTFSMLALVLSSNIMQMYIFWELVGVSSFLLIGFYYDRPEAVAACKKAFIITRFADLGFLVGILILSFYGGSLDFSGIIQKLTSPESNEFKTAAATSFLGLSALTWGLALVFVGGAGKSAMFPFHVWLPPAMEGPTPVSALIHAATMVVAGVFLVARLFPVFKMSTPVLQVLSYVGIFSSLFAAIIASTQTDIKKVLAYSTISQIGFMMCALGISKSGVENDLGYSASMFHLFTHAIFKALLFLCAGSVIHHVHSNDMEKMGGLRKHLPVTHITFLTACLAISGIPPFSGFFSKEEILWAAFQSNSIIFAAALVSSGLTAFYISRLYFSVFWNKEITLSDRNVHTGIFRGEAGIPMILPLLILAFLSVITGFIPFGNFISANGTAIKVEFHPLFSIAPIVFALIGISVAMWLYKKHKGWTEYGSLLTNRWYKAGYNGFYVDKAYRFITKKMIFNLIGKSSAWFDLYIIDGLVKAIGDTTLAISVKIKGIQSGKLQQYALYFLAGILSIMTIFIYLWK